VVCSACGFESPAGLRFCGMCGMPLPHRPITAPGAHSTLNFTRVPVDARVSGSNASNTFSSGHAGVLLETPPAGSNGSETEHADYAVGEATNRQPGVFQTQPADSAGVVEAPDAKAELAPDVPLDHYVETFRYAPPQEPVETGMRGEATVAQPAAIDTSVATPIERTTAPVDSASQPNEPAITPSPVPIATVQDVDNRLGLEPEAAAESTIPRPRFLDINEPQQTPPGSAATTISGPSFLGLSEPPQSRADDTPVEQTHTSSWRFWFAAAVALIFVVLGVLEWRSQTKQSYAGPVEVIRTRLRNWRHGTPQSSNSPAAPATADSHAQPEMQVQEQPKPAPQPNTEAETAASSGQPVTAQPSVAPANTAGESATGVPPASRGSNTTPPQPIEVSPKTAAKEAGTGAPATDAKASVASGTRPAQPSVADKPKAKSSEDNSDGQEVTTRKFVPGADEMMKAKNASDAAATAAWLWKATAKGNPDAPVQLANMYIQGDGVPRSCEQAMVLLKTAGAKQNARARNRLASLYSTGTCVQRNRVEAYRWMSAALDADPNSQWAQQNRSLMWGQMTPEERVLAAKYR
jgi:hypothetical protein